jgi:hypothetical protein
MTSIMHPGTYARLHAVQAKQSLSDAATVLRNDLPTEPIEKGRVGIPEHNGPDSPDNPWFIGRPNPDFIDPAQQATIHANTGISHITTALGVESELSAGVVTALNRAREDALTGVRILNPAPNELWDTSAAPLRFDASTMWLDLAVNLLDLDMRGAPAR